MKEEPLFVLEADGQFSRVLSQASLEKLIQQTRIGGTIYLVALKKVGEANVSLTWGHTSEAPITEIPRREAGEEGSAVPEAPKKGSGESGGTSANGPQPVFIQPRKRGRPKSLAMGN